MKLYYRLEKFNSERRQIARGRRYRSRSFLKPFLYALNVGFGASSISIVDTGGSSRTYSSFDSSRFAHTHPGRDTSYDSSSSKVDDVGIQVGTGDTAVAVTDYALKSRIVHGTGSGELTHLGCYVRNDTLNTGTDTATFDIEKMFLNESGGTITVKETGVYYSYTGSYTFCSVRDVISPTVSVLDGEYLKVTYTVSVTA